MAHSLRRGCEFLIHALPLAVLLSLAVAASSRAAPGERGLYQPEDVETVSGEVARVETLPRAGGGGRDVTLVLRTAIGDEVRVGVAPLWVLKALGLRLRQGDVVRVVGWRIVTGKPPLLAAEIEKGRERFVFRDRRGVAVWGPHGRFERR